MIWLRNKFRKQSTSRQIVIIVVVIFGLVLLFASVEKILVYNTVQAAQQEIPSMFFQKYQEYSLKQTAILVKQLIFSQIDFRASFIASMANIINYSKTHKLPVTQPNTSKIFSAQPLQTNCLLLTPTSTIFSCSTDIYTKYIMQSDQWLFQESRTIRRLNLIYQNLKEEADIMIKTISERHDIVVGDSGKVTTKMGENQEGILRVSNFHEDFYGNSSQALVSFSTKLGFQGYRVLIQMETDGTQFTLPLSRILLSDQTNVAILVPKPDSGYQIITSFKPVQPQIDFSHLLHEGFHRQSTPSFQIASYTIPFSSSHKLGQLNYAKQKLQNENYSIIVYTANINSQIKSTIFGGIANLRNNLKDISILFLVVIVAIGALTIGLSYLDMKRNFRVYGEMIGRYMRGPGEFGAYVNCKNQEIYPLLRSNSFLRILNSVIKMIQWKKKEFKRKCNHHVNDQFPLNTFEEGFQEAHNWKDFSKLQQFYRRLEKLQKPKPDKASQESPNKNQKRKIN